MTETQESWEASAQNKIFWMKTGYHLMLLPLFLLAPLDFSADGIIPHPSLAAWIFYFMICLVVTKFPLINGANFVGFWRSSILTGARAIMLSIFIIFCTLFVASANELEILPNKIDWKISVSILLPFIYSTLWYKLGMSIYKAELKYRERKYGPLPLVKTTF